MKIVELREKSDVELDRLLGEQRNRLMELRFKLTARQLSKVRDIRQARQAIAQILTVKRSRRSEAKQ